MPSYCQRCGEMMKGSSCSCGGRGAQQKGMIFIDEVKNWKNKNKTINVQLNLADSFSGDGNAPVHTQYTDALVFLFLFFYFYLSFLKKNNKKSNVKFLKKICLCWIIKCQWWTSKNVGYEAWMDW